MIFMRIQPRQVRSVVRRRVSLVGGRIGDRRLIGLLVAAAVILLGACLFFAFVYPQTPGRAGRASATLIGRLPLWTTLASVVPSPHTRGAVALSIVLATVAAFAAYAIANTRAECALRDHPTLSRYLRQTKTGRLVIDRRKIAAEQRLDGKYLLSSSDPDLSAEEIALGYKNLREAERSFRDLKTTLELRPVFHRLEHRIRAHVVVCWLALLLIRLAERNSGQSWRRIAIELQRLHLVTLQGEAGAVQQTTQLTHPQRDILAMLEVEPPPRITALEPA